MSAANFINGLCCFAVGLILWTKPASSAMFDPVRQTFYLPMPRNDQNWFYRAFIANENANVFLQAQCKSDSAVNETFTLTWTLHYVPCGVNKLDGVRLHTLGSPCQNDTKTEFITSEMLTFKCSTTWTNVPLISERLTKPTSFPACLNKTISPHQHTDSEILVSTWRSGSYLFYADVEPVDTVSDDLKWMFQISMQVKTPRNGYLPAPNQPLLPFWTAIMAVYCLIVAVWLVLCAKDWRGVVRIHSVITVAILSGFIESSMSLAVVYGVNKLGYPRVAVNIMGELAAAFKGTIVRILLIVIAMGYGSTKANRFRRPIFGPIALFAVFYFVSVSVPAVMGVLKPIYSRMFIYSRIPSLVANTISVTWIIISLFKTARILRHHGDQKKLAAYNLLVGVMGLCLLASVIFIAVRIYIGIKSPCPLWWIWWLDDAYWVLIALFMLFAVCYLWRPSQTTLMWAYSSLQNEEDETYSRTAPQRRPEQDILSADDTTL